MEVRKLETQTQVITTKEVTVAQLECQYQTVIRKKDHIDKTEKLTDIDEIFKKAVPKSSFLHKYHAKTTEKISPYAPMDVGKKPTKSFFRLSYEYPYWSKFRASKAENYDHGYYLIKKENKPVEKNSSKADTQTLKLKSVSATEQFDLCFTEEHFYEDLCYVDNKKISKVKRRNSTGSVANSRNFKNKIQGIFSVIKVPFRAKIAEETAVSTAVEVKGDMAEEKDTKREVKVDNDEKKNVKGHEKEIDLYVNSGSVGNLYDVVNPIPRKVVSEDEITQVVDVSQGECTESIYSDVAPRVGDKSDSILDFIYSLIENMFSRRKEINDDLNVKETIQPVTTVKDGGEIQKSSVTDRKSKINMASRPLPVPVDNEPYFMNIGRSEAEEMLLGQPDGCFILRPSSQASHEYTLSVACGKAVHNVGVRKRPDGRLALGFERKSERCFSSIEGLVRHHRRRRLLLVASGGVLGGTALTEPPLYYLTPSSLPVVAEDQTSL